MTGSLICAAKRGGFSVSNRLKRQLIGSALIPDKGTLDVEDVPDGLSWEY
jgi:hypothetical protein